MAEWLSRRAVAGCTRTGTHQATWPALLLRLGRHLPAAWAQQRRLAILCAMARDLQAANALVARRLEHLAHADRLQPHRRAGRALPDRLPLEDADPAAALRSTVTRLRAAGLTPFLSFGTLLGAVRDGDFVASDSDVDLGLFADAVQPDVLRDLFSRRGDVRTTLGTRLNPRPHLVKLVHRSAVPVDLVLFERRADAFVTRIECFGHVLERRRRPFQLRQSRLCDVDVHVPDPPESFLDESYGDWRRPDPHYHYLLSSRLPLDADDPLVRLLAQLAVLAALDRRQWARARALAATALARRIDTPALARIAGRHEVAL